MPAGAGTPSPLRMLSNDRGPALMGSIPRWINSQLRFYFYKRTEPHTPLYLNCEETDQPKPIAKPLRVSAEEEGAGHLYLRCPQHPWWPQPCPSAAECP